MKTELLIVGLLAVAAVSPCCAEEGFVPLFDGRTLEGWVQHGSGGPFFVENGEIVARTKDDPTGAYLCTTREYENFVFRGEYRFEASGNSGIQFRSQIITNKSGRTACAGYQCEMTPDGQNTTRIFDQSRTGFRFKDCRAKIWFDCNTPYARIMAARQSFFDVGSNAWQQVEIRCEGPRIRTWLNGLPVVDILDATELKGVFGLQLHPGKVGGVRWRNLRVKELPPNPAWKPFVPKNPGAHGDCAIRWKVANTSRPSATWFEKAANRVEAGFDEEMLWKVPYTNKVNVCESIYLGARAVHRVNMIEFFDVEHSAHDGAKPLRFRAWGRGTGEAFDFEILDFPVSSTVKHLEDRRSEAAKPVSAKPEVLLIGDSIRMGYCGDAGRELKDVADVRWPAGNCSNSQNILIQLSSWRGLVSNPKVIQFNCGHWDASRWDGDENPITSVEEYGKNLRLIVRRLRRDYPDAKLVFATTTRTNPSGTVGKNIRTTDDIRRYNAKAKEVMAAEGVVVNDLFAATENWPSDDFADYCHFTKAANRRLGKLVADFLRKQL